ncbi:TetR/AcrR family transcriptional regulator [Ramlibacter sp. XY19]|uniref:TetR family transcriptional regulator n=1 Tax=Ramlibacter paludis TaxID=2908000 RepID=UPI0023DC78C8|nr:TetR family transcriptional regulator [Ramlibacter paludis]MCG2591444.1 TetR/AcrR family transcriptional regulator [Ramlibacter paludis]
MATSRRRATPAAPTSSYGDSGRRLVQAARELVAERGLSGLKVVDVASRAGANVALINYHFGGRDGLLDEVIRGMAAQIAGERLDRLSLLLATESSPDPREVLRCWIQPWIENVQRPHNREVMQMMLHLMFAADVDRKRKEHVLEESVKVTALYLDALSNCYPTLPRDKMMWRMLCAIGASYLVLGQGAPVGWNTLAGVEARPSPPRSEDGAEELVTFILAGFAAPAQGASTKQPRRRKISPEQH